MGILYLFTRLVLLSNSPQAPLRAEFDIPSLLGKNVYEIKAILGTPSSDNEDPLSAENFVEFSRTLSSVFLPYDRRTGTIINDGPHGGLFLSEPGGTHGKDRLLELGNLDENDARYSLTFVNVMRSGAPEAGHHTGVVIRPK